VFDILRKCTYHYTSFVVTKTRNQPKRPKTTQSGQQKHPQRPKTPQPDQQKDPQRPKTIKKWNSVKQKSKSEKFRQNS